MGWTSHIDVQAFKTAHRRQFFRSTRHQVSFFAENLHKQTRLIRVTLDERDSRGMIARSVHIAHRTDHLSGRQITALFKAQETAENLRRQLKGYLDEAQQAKNEISELKRQLFKQQQNRR